jgi:hypothetical protein
VNKGLLYGPVTSSQLVCFHDADFAADAVSRKSISGYVWMIGGTALQWKSKQQDFVADSTTSAEYTAGAAAFKEGLWLRELVAEIFGVRMSLIAHCDNQATVAVIQKGLVDTRAKHLAIKYFFMHQHVVCGNIQLDWIDTDRMVADCLTKQVSANKVASFARALGLL